MACAKPRFNAAVLAALFFLGGARSACALPPRLLLLDGAFAGTDIVAVGERSTIVRSTDNAQTWTTAAPTTSATLTGIAFAPDGVHGWAVGHDALILATSDGGHSWSKQWQSENLQDSFLGALALDAQRAFAVGAYGLFLTTSDGGKTWTRKKITDDDYHFNRLTRGPSGTLYLAGEHGTLLRSTDAGATWGRMVSPYTGSFYGVLPLDKRTLLAHGLSGRVFRSADDGATWTQIETPQPPMLLAAGLQMKSNFLVLAGQARAHFVSRDYGKTVVPWPVSFDSAVAALLELPDGSVLALGEAGPTLLPKP
jgi:photosystem II stability/assembly factor-like uncharacterized protein